ncbi:cation-transporting P-type ATPase [Spirosoma harenae]
MESQSTLSTLSSLGEWSGLASAEARLRLAQYGPNKLETTPPERWLTVLIRQFKSSTVWLLAAAARSTIRLPVIDMSGLHYCSA